MNSETTETPCGLDIPDAQYDQHIGDCRDCQQVALDEEAAELLWERITR